MGNSDSMNSMKSKNNATIKPSNQSKFNTKGCLQEDGKVQAHQTCMSDQDEQELDQEDSYSQRVQTEQYNNERMHSRKDLSKNSKECSRRINAHFSHLMQDEHLAAFYIQSYFRNWLINKYEKEMAMKTIKPKIVIYGSSISVNSKAKKDYENCLDILNSVGIPYENRDLYLDKLYIVETQPYGGANCLPIIVVNDIFIGEGLLIKSMSANDLNDKLQELIVTQHTELTDGRRYFFFSKPIVEYTPDIFQTNNKRRENNKSFDKSNSNKNSMSFHYHTQTIDFSNSRNLGRVETEIEEKKDLNKSQMIIDKNILDEFLENDHTFRDSANDKQSLSFVNFKAKTFC